LAGINPVADQFSQEYFLIGIQRFFDEGKNVLGVDRYIAFFGGGLGHGISFCPFAFKPCAKGVGSFKGVNLSDSWQFLVF
ncbi:MAG: hypothetical protein ACKO9W_15385, partial [Bacteroidota bacterium]